MTSGILISGLAEEDIITTIIRAWREQCPGDAKSFDYSVNEHRKALRKASGVSSGPSPFGGDSAVVGHVPGVVHFMVQRYLPDFWDRPDSSRVFFGIYKKAGIKGA